MDPNDLVEIYSTTMETEAEVVRNRLEEDEIESTVSGANQGGFAGALEVKVYVKAIDAERAREIVGSH
ncbi:MAG: putative prokaryotic signal transducing protein [Planctomycetaceae bacterium]|nr:putative prokaryotic signal transducing protein [Planctomycetaceae bacterium]